MSDLTNEEKLTNYETMLHIEKVRRYMKLVIDDLRCRSIEHDRTKLERPEVDMFTRVTGKLATLEYGSEEYKQSLQELGPALEHHYTWNDHHPEHHSHMRCPGCEAHYDARPNPEHEMDCATCGARVVAVDGINEMDLVQLIEMLCDWKAAGERHKDGSLKRSLEVNRERFKMTEQTYRTLFNTALNLGWL